MPDDLLIPQHIREIRGSFFTPKIWADKSKEYLADVFGSDCHGSDWQNEYYIWDCAAGTGNLLAGLANPSTVWASDIEQRNVETMQSLIGLDKHLNLLPSHIFQFDFLNDSFDKLPEELRKIIDDKEKRKKLIVYINPPYAEATNARTVSGTGKNRIKVSKQHAIHNEYKTVLGKAANELYSLFMIRIADTCKGAYLAVFSTMKYINSSNFARFRAAFSARFLKGFVCPSNTFDNVQGRFPIGFLIWQLSYNDCDFKFPKSVKLDVFNADGKRAPIEKEFHNSSKSINNWIKEYTIYKNDIIGFMGNYAPDFQNAHQPYIMINKGFHHINYFAFNKENIIEGCIYFAVRLCIEHTWLNNQDQFLYPNDGYKDDAAFQNNCLVFTLFHGKNYISRSDGINHWIPFTEEEAGAKEQFESGFMRKYLKDKPLSPEARAVLSAGRELWKYYHAKIRNGNTANDCGRRANASFYDIRQFFQGRRESGAGNCRMNATSADETYNTLIGSVRDAQKALAAKIAPKAYEYGFLL
ncbi:MAG: hypothetical protein LBG74_01435 [Spirochaetaceae bacterium]|nr:hypothetical protein [Spirochaetaceae bacterium]